MDETQIKHVIEAALLAAGRPLPLDTLASLFSSRSTEVDKATLRRALDALSEDYRERGLELKEVASGYRIQIKSSITDWLTPLWEERAPRYTRALLETLALIAYRQPITRAEIEEVRGVSVSSNIIRTLLERNWIRVVGHRDVPGKPEMFGTTKEFLDYFGLRKLEDLPALAEIKDGFPELDPQTDLLATASEANEGEGVDAEGQAVGVSEAGEPEQGVASAESDEDTSARGEESVEDENIATVAVDGDGDRDAEDDEDAAADDDEDDDDEDDEDDEEEEDDDDGDDDEDEDDDDDDDEDDDDEDDDDEDDDDEDDDDEDTRENVVELVDREPEESLASTEAVHAASGSVVGADVENAPLRSEPSESSDESSNGGDDEALDRVGAS